MTGELIRRSADATMVVPVAPMRHQEVDHRVANSLQLISSLLSMQAREACDQFVCDALHAAVHRIDAVAAVHQQLYRSSSSHAVDIAPYLLELAAKIEQGCSGSVGRKQITADIQSFEVPADFASMLGILINELVINACKHAYAPDEPGNIDICLFFLNRSEFRMEVRDYGGIGDVHKAPIASGLGMRIIDAMGRKLNAAYVPIADDEGTRILMPGSPWETGFIESFNARLRDELLDGEIFYTLNEAKIVIESWRRHFNTLRPHGSLGYKPPAPGVFVPALTAWAAAQTRSATPPVLAARPTIH